MFNPITFSGTGLKEVHAFSTAFSSAFPVSWRQATAPKLRPYRFERPLDPLGYLEPGGSLEPKVNLFLTKFDYLKIEGRGEFGGRFAVPPTVFPLIIPLRGEGAFTLEATSSPVAFLQSTTATGTFGGAFSVQADFTSNALTNLTAGVTFVTGLLFVEATLSLSGSFSASFSLDLHFFPAFSEDFSSSFG